MLVLAHILTFKQQRFNTWQSGPVSMIQHQINLPAEAPHTNSKGAEQQRSKNKSITNKNPSFSAQEYVYVFESFTWAS